jgi:septum formation protein
MLPSVILASQSPRRQKLLHILGLDFSVITTDTIEVVEDGESPEEVVLRLAEQKADVVAEQHTASLVIGADTIVALDNQILGKPVSRSDARTMLQALSGRSHHVFTGVSLQHRRAEKRIRFFERTTVEFGDLTISDIDQYLDTGSAYDKAGSYGIQDDRGALFVRQIQGDFYNVMGLPIYRLNQEMKAHFPSFFSEHI